jgi:hypothetical protein
MVGDAVDHLAQIGFRIEAVELGGFNERVSRGGALAAGIGAGEQIVLAAERNLTVILPISGRRSKSIIGGTRSLDVVSGFAAASNVIPAALPTSRRRPAW